jgi:hypothetical protein
VTGALGYALYTAAPAPVSFHVGLGLGVYQRHIERDRNQVGNFPGVGAVLGVKLGEGRVRGLIEAQQQAMVIVNFMGDGPVEGGNFAALRFGISVQTR